MAGSARIAVSCPGCGDVRVDAPTAEVHRNPRDGFALYAVACPGCGELLVGAGADELAALEAAGARRLELRPACAPPICRDDLLAFHEWLATDPAWPAP
jgi:hypothetical protein